MMKLTVAFLATLAAADASKVHHRHARRQYGYGPAPGVPVANSTVATTTTGASSTLPASSPVALSSTDVSPEKPTTPAEVPTYGEGKPSPSVPGVSFPGTGTMPGTAGTASPSEVATPLPTTSLSPVGGANSTSSTSSFPTFHLTGTDGTFPTAVPTGVMPSGTGPASENSVTVTITSYQVFTSTVCPEGVSNCAGSAKTTKLITSAVPIGTTVCGEKEASSIMSSVSNLHSAPATATATATGAVGTPVPSTVVEDHTKTLTATVGTGENAHLTTYTITDKVTKTVYVTAGPSPSEAGEAPKSEPTTTLTTDITSTIGVTLTVTEGLPTGGNAYPTGPKPSGVPVTPEGSQAPGGGEGECAPPVTVTVTAKETVTVTEGSSTGTAVPDDVPSHETSTGASGPSDKPTGVPHPSKPTTPEKPTGMPTGAPYPTGNGTAPVVPGSTGFVTSTKPSKPEPTGELPGYGSAPAPSSSAVAPTGATSSDGLPSFEFPTPTPAGEPATETSVAPEAPTPVESGAYGPGYGYGKKRSLFGLF